MSKVLSFVKVICFVTAALIAGTTLTGLVVARDRSDRVELTANQIVAELDARIARIKADLRQASWIQLLRSRRVPPTFATQSAVKRT
jgi:hypothetical protein